MKISTLFYLLIFILYGHSALSQQSGQDKDNIPKWVKDTWANEVRESGLWIAPNPYFSESVPYDAYGMKWEYGPGATTLKGRLFAMLEKEDVFTLWELLQYWHPVDKKLITIEYGRNPGLGNLVIGESYRTSIQNRSESISTVFVPDGSTYQVGHRSELVGDKLHTTSYNIVDSVWKERGAFTWTLQPKESDINYLEDFNFLIGNWNAAGKRRKEWLANSEEWIEYTAESSAQSLMNGHMVIDEMQSLSTSSTSATTTIRIYNQLKDEWTIYWASNAYPALGLSKQVVGKFENGIGTFYGEELFKNKLVKLRWQWRINKDGQPHWEQAYYNQETNDWEVNWIFDLARKQCHKKI